MSWSALIAAQRLPIQGCRKSVLVTLASHLNHETGRCDPSIARLAFETGMSRDTVLRSVSKLEEDGHLICARILGSRTSYRLVLDPPAETLNQSLGATGGTGQPVAQSNGSEGVTSRSVLPDQSLGATGPVARCHPNRKEPKEEPKEKREREIADATAAPQEKIRKGKPAKPTKGFQEGMTLVEVLKAMRAQTSRDRVSIMSEWTALAETASPETIFRELTHLAPKERWPSRVEQSLDNQAALAQESAPPPAPVRHSWSDQVDRIFAEHTHDEIARAMGIHPAVEFPLQEVAENFKEYRAKLFAHDWSARRAQS